MSNQLNQAIQRLASRSESVTTKHRHHVDKGPVHQLPVSMLLTELTKLFLRVLLQDRTLGLWARDSDNSRSSNAKKECLWGKIFQQFVAHGVIIDEVELHRDVEEDVCSFLRVEQPVRQQRRLQVRVLGDFLAELC